MWCYSVQVRAEGHPGKDADGPDTLDRTQHFRLTDSLTDSAAEPEVLRTGQRPHLVDTTWTATTHLKICVSAQLSIISLIFTFVCLFLSTAKCHNSSFFQSDVQYILKHTHSDSLGQILSEPVCGVVWLDLPDEVGVHEFRSDWSQDLVVAVLHQAQLTGVKDHAHLRRSHKKKRRNTRSAAPIHCCLRSTCRHTHIFIFKEELLVAPGAGPRHLADRKQSHSKVSDLL